MSKKHLVMSSIPTRTSRAFVDGVEIENCIGIEPPPRDSKWDDTHKPSYVLAMDVDENGEPITQGDKLVTKRIYGEVTVTHSDLYEWKITESEPE